MAFKQQLIIPNHMAIRAELALLKPTLKEIASTKNTRDLRLGTDPDMFDDICADPNSPWAQPEISAGTRNFIEQSVSGLGKNVHVRGYIGLTSKNGILCYIHVDESVTLRETVSIADTDINPNTMVSTSHAEVRAIDWKRTKARDLSPEQLKLFTQAEIGRIGLFNGVDPHFEMHLPEGTPKLFLSATYRPRG